MVRTALLSFVLAACGARTTVGTSPQIGVPPDAPKTCAGYCQQMGLTLDAVVVMANNVGCVCNARPEAPAPTAPTAPTAAGASTAAGMTAIMLQQQAAAASAQSSSSSHHH